MEYRGFHVTSYQANFAKSSYSRPPCWFPLNTEQYWKIQQNTTVTFYLDHTTIPNYDWVTRMLAHKLGENCNSSHEVNQKCMRFCCCFSLSIPSNTKRKPSGRAKKVRVWMRTASWEPSISFCKSRLNWNYKKKKKKKKKNVQLTLKQSSYGITSRLDILKVYSEILYWKNYLSL